MWEGGGWMLVPRNGNGEKHSLNPCSDTVQEPGQACGAGSSSPSSSFSEGTQQRTIGAESL